MSKFTSSLIVSIPPDGEIRTLIKPFSYSVGNNKVIIEVPIGFITDGASIPKIAWSIIGSPMTGKYIYAAVLHDYCYFIKTFSRKKSDQIFLEAMEILGVSKLKRKIIYYAVRAGGRWAWKKSSKNRSKIHFPG